MTIDLLGQFALNVCADGAQARRLPSQECPRRKAEGAAAPVTSVLQSTVS